MLWLVLFQVLGFRVKVFTLGVYFQALGSELMVEGLMLSNGPMGVKHGAESAPMEAWRVQNGGPMAQDGGPEGATCHPKGLREARAPLGARQGDAKRHLGGLRTGSCAFLRSIFGPKGAKKDPKANKK